MGKCSPIQKQASGITYTGDWTGLSGATEVQLATVPTAGYFKQGYPLAKSDGTVLVPDIDFAYDARLDSAGGGAVNIYDPGVEVTLATLKYFKICALNGANIVEASGGGYTQILAKQLPSASNPAASIAWVDPVSGRYKGIGGVEVHKYLHSYWKMDAGRGANETNEIQASGYDLVQTGTVPSGVGKLGTSRGVYSASNYFTITNDSAYEAKTFIIEAWVKMSYNDDWNYIAGNTDLWSSSGSNGGWLLWVGYNAGKASFWVYGITAMVSTNRIDDGNWHYLVAGVRSISGANEIRLYVDNVLNAQTAGYDWPICRTNPPFVVGARYNGWYPNTGLIDDVAYWNTVPGDWATIESIISQRYNGGAGLEYGQGAVLANYYYLAAASDPAKVALASMAGTNVKIAL